jgi:hypothetical protein
MNKDAIVGKLLSVRVHAVEFSGAGIAFCGLTPEDAFKLGFVVFSGDLAAHGGSIPKCRRERNELIQNEKFG